MFLGGGQAFSKCACISRWWIDSCMVSMDKVCYNLSMMIWLYRLFFPFLFAVAFPFHLVKMYRRGSVSVRWYERFGWYGSVNGSQFDPGKKRLWIQVVSVGEAQAVVPLVSALCKSGNCLVFLTTTTHTARAVLIHRFSGQPAVWIGYFPYDFVCCSLLAWRSIKPDHVLLTESELWPEHLHQARSRGVPVWLINARHSSATMAWYRRFPRLARWLYRPLDRVYFTSNRQMSAVHAIMPDAQHFYVMGQLKLDLPIYPLGKDEKARLYHEMGFAGITQDTVFLMGASLWPGEEDMVLEALVQLRQQDVDARVILVPRHAEKGRLLVQAAQARGLVFSQRSTSLSSSEKVVVHVADTTGEMHRLCQCVDVALIGKSFSPYRGGQSPIELAAFGVSMVYGPHMSNFIEISEDLEQAGLSQRVPDAAAATKALISLVLQRSSRLRNKDRLLAWFQAQQGGLSRLLAALERHGVSQRRV
ncbi:MAG: hypothetical protein CMF52_06280 [Legionellales bacterium]|nr:hypothetical protein [Legionellales bacterium]HAV93615.1 hypothetical protein [Pseudomonadota bacterium]